MAGWRWLRGWETGPAAFVLVGMALFAAGVYVAVVRGGGALIGETDSPNLALSVLATSIVALGFEPARRWLRPVASQFARGERAGPYEVLTRFPTQIAGAYPTEEVPARMATLLAEATGVRYAQVWLMVNGRLTLAASGTPGSAGALERRAARAPSMKRRAVRAPSTKRRPTRPSPREDDACSKCGTAANCWGSSSCRSANGSR